MKKIILIDGNNFLFRSYYATAYQGNIMKNSKGFPTNALYGFINMINKIIKEEESEYIVVAFDKGKTFRHDMYKDYKKGRAETPEELIKQFPVAKEILTAMGITYLEIDNYEADDIIGTLSKQIEKSKDYKGLIVSSDKDLLQLVNNKNEMKLLKGSNFEMVNQDNFNDIYEINPEMVIDLKALQGDPSDNIKGVKGIGEKTALKLLKEYQTLENIYKNIDNIKGKVRENLITDKESAFFSRELATIYNQVPLDVKLEDLKYNQSISSKLKEIYHELEFFSMLKDEPVVNKSIDVTYFKDVKQLENIKPVSAYLTLDNYNYHRAQIIGLSLYNEEINLFIPKEKLLKLNGDSFKKIKYTYDLKSLIVALKKINIKIDNEIEDVMLIGALLDYNLKDDVSHLAKYFNYNISTNTKYQEMSEEEIIQLGSLKAKFIFEIYQTLEDKLKEIGSSNIYRDLELPLVKILSEMEDNGVAVDSQILKDIKEEIKVKIELLEKDIYNYTGEEFNILSPKQLSDILFIKLNLPPSKKIQSGYSTDIEVLNKLKLIHPIINLIIEYRMLNKLYSTYLEGLLKSIINHKIHTIYTQTLTRTGRLSSVEPNLQNIPIRYNEGRIIRKAFLPTKGNLLLSADYSQIELRMFAHLSKNKKLIEAFNNNLDIHTKTAMEIFDIDEELVTKEKRRKAKAVNFGIIYGISDFGLANDLNVPITEATEFKLKYFQAFSGIKEYMDKLIKECQEKGYVTTIMGRRRYIDEINNPNYMIRKSGERMALNTPIQGSSADIIKKAMIEITKQFKLNNLNSNMILQIHDELIFDVEQSEKELVEKIVKETMESIFTLEVPLKVNLEWGKDWYEIS